MIKSLCILVLTACKRYLALGFGKDLAVAEYTAVGVGCRVEAMEYMVVVEVVEEEA